LKRLVIGAVVVGLLIGALAAGYYLYAQPGMTNRIQLDGVTLTVELATTPAAQQQGLSDRDSMAADHGMLFVFNQEAEWGFWMHEMRFPLDIIWFNANRQVVFIEGDLPPCPPAPANCPVYTPPVNAMYVLEVNSGFVQANGVKVGDTFSFV
jgi:uncharacterized membrane protein (UPF0127 family)